MLHGEPVALPTLIGKAEAISLSVTTFSAVDLDTEKAISLSIACVGRLAV
jgi:hypothetical protein